MNLGKMVILAIILVIGFIVGSIILAAWHAKERRKALAKLANSLGFTFSPGKDFTIDDQYGFLKKLAQGSNRYAFNLMSGAYGGHDVLVFDYHFETRSSGSKGRRQTHHHYFSFFILHLAREFPELTISHEGLFSKVAQFFGYDDIDFESAEFSRRFCVRCSDKKFAYDICNPRVIEYLLVNPALNIEIDRHCLSLFFSFRLSAESIQANLNRLVSLRVMFPDYLWQK